MGNTSFIGSRGENCTGGWENAGPISLHLPFAVQSNTTKNSILQDDFIDAELIMLTCLQPPSAEAVEYVSSTLQSLSSSFYLPCRLDC